MRAIEARGGASADAPLPLIGRVAALASRMALGRDASAADDDDEDDEDEDEEATLMDFRVKGTSSLVSVWVQME